MARFTRDEIDGMLRFGAFVGLLLFGLTLIVIELFGLLPAEPPNTQVDNYYARPFLSDFQFVRERSDTLDDICTANFGPPTSQSTSDCYDAVENEMGDEFGSWVIEAWLSFLPPPRAVCSDCGYYEGYDDGYYDGIYEDDYEFPSDPSDTYFDQYEPEEWEPWP